MSGMIHGGDLTAAAARFGTPKDGWLDLSTGINPQPYPFLPPETAAWQRLPLQAELDHLIDAAATRYGAREPGCIVAAPGSQALLQWLPRLIAPTQVAVIGPTYGEYAPAFRAGGHDVRVAASLESIGQAGIVVLANPNNPDGRRLAPQDLLKNADSLAARGGVLLADEAFADPAPEVSLAAAAGRPGLVILRSLGKFYGLAGLRLGFALASPALAEKLRQAIGPWAISGPALAIGAQALEDAAWAAETRGRLTLASAKLADLLRRAGGETVGGTALFQLVRHERAAALHEHLGQRGILTRAFADNPTWLRFGLPAARDFSRLEAALAAFA